MADAVALWWSSIGTSKSKKLIIFIGLIISFSLFIISTDLLGRITRSTDQTFCFKDSKDQVILDPFFRLENNGCRSTIMEPFLDDLIMNKRCDSDPLNFFLLWSTGRDQWKLKHYRVIDSIFTYHPNARVYLITKFMYATDFAFYSERYDLIHVVMDPKKIFENTPLERWLKETPNFKEHQYFFSHLTDAIRLALLWKYGGVYMDTDAILIRNIDKVRNAVGLQHPSEIASGNEFNGAVMVFDRMHPFLYYAMHRLISTYDPDRWDTAGPDVITSCVNGWSALHPFMLRWIPRHEVGTIELPNEPVGSPFVTVFLDQYAFYPVSWWNTSDRFDMNPTHSELPRYKIDVEKRTYVYHYFNQMIRNDQLAQGRYLYELLQKACLFECSYTNLEIGVTHIIDKKA